MSEKFVPSPYSLGKLIDWKLDIWLIFLCCFECLPPYSLGKLIDWKRTLCASCPNARPRYPSPYSLGKLIDWKQQITAIKPGGRHQFHSLLAREINWLETRSQSWPVTSPCAHSLLAREINWLETRQQRLFRVPKSRNLSPYSLGKLIDWKPLVRYSNSQVSWRTLPTR